jgi:hypothetical protein
VTEFNAKAPRPKAQGKLDCFFASPRLGDLALSLGDELGESGSINRA